jgi:hypothetical protein
MKKKASDSRNVLLESYDIRLKRTEYVKKIAQLRKKERNIVFTDKTCTVVIHKVRIGLTIKIAA